MAEIHLANELQKQSDAVAQPANALLLTIQLVTYTMLYVLKYDEPLQITISKMWNWVTRKHKNSPFPPRGQQLVSDWKMRASLLAKSLIISKDTMTKLKII